MEINENKDGLDLSISVSLVEADYQRDIEILTKDYHKGTSIKGFRPGNAPMSIINKIYGKKIREEAIRKLFDKTLQEYVKANEIKYFFQPVFEDEKIDFQAKEQTIVFEFGLKPELDELNVTGIKLTKYNVAVNEESLNNHIKYITKRFGKIAFVDKVENDDVVVCFLKEDVIVGEPKTLTIDVDMAKVSNKLALLGLKKNEHVKIKMSDISYDINALAQKLKETVEVVEKKMSKMYDCEVVSISRLLPCEINQDIFDKFFGKGVVKDLADFKIRISKAMVDEGNDNSKRMLLNDLVGYIADVKKVKMPDSFIEKYLIKASEGKINESNVKAQSESYKKQMKWNIIESKLVETFKVDVTDVDIRNYIVAWAKTQFPGITDVDLERVVLYNMGNDKHREGIQDTIFNDRIMAAIESNCKISEQEIDYKEFFKLMEKRKEEGFRKPKSKIANLIGI